MFRLNRTGCRYGVALALLLALALTVRAAVPVGWMPSNGAFTIELCAEAGVTEAWIDADGNIHKSAPQNGAPNHHCAFAGLSSPLTLQDVALPLTPAPAALAADSDFPIAVDPGRGLAAPPPYQTGPPFLV